MAYSDIKDPSAHFHTQIWTGAGGSPRAITNDANSGNFQPDFVWTKGRNEAYEHQLYDSSRGTGTTKGLDSGSTAAEGIVSATYGYLSSFDSNGFTGTAGTSGQNAYFDTNAKTYAAWQWKANGGTTTSVSASGTGANCINASTHQVNQDAGFSIITYTGRADQITVHQQTNLTHGLGVAPDLTIMKKRDATGSWVVMGKHVTTSSAYSANEHLRLDTSDAVSAAEYTGYVAPTSTYIYLGDALVNDTDNDYVCYAFAEKQGYSKFGKYTGNGSADGPFIYTGFKPAFIIVKKSSGTGNWLMYDNKRGAFNLNDEYFYANSNAGESTSSTSGYDFLSSGFKTRNTYNDGNVSGQTYIYIAFAENPFVAGGIPTTAR